jgi:hypothetical protein
MTKLVCLKHLMEEIMDKALCNKDFMLESCHESCEAVLRSLEKLRKRVPTESEGTGKQRVLNISAFRRWKEDVEALERGIQGTKFNLIL